MQSYVKEVLKCLHLNLDISKLWHFIYRFLFCFHVNTNTVHKTQKKHNGVTFIQSWIHEFKKEEKTES